MQSVGVNVGKSFFLDTQFATELIKVASRYESEIWVEKDGKKANAKSLLGLLSLGLVAGCSLTVVAEGSDENDAINSLKELVMS